MMSGHLPGLSAGQTSLDFDWRKRLAWCEREKNDVGLADFEAKNADF